VDIATFIAGMILQSNTPLREFNLATPGRMLVTGGHGDDGHVHLYAWHDGHTSQAFELMCELPFVVFYASKQMAKASRNNSHPPIQTGVGGPWFYDVYVQRSTALKYHEFDILFDSFKAMIPLQTSAISVANWVVWRNFNHWHVIPTLDWASHAGDKPAITVAVNDERINDYLISVDTELNHDGFFGLIERKVEELNKLTKHPSAKIKIRGRKTLTDDKKDWILPEVYVPFDCIIIDLLHQDIVHLNEEENKRRNPEVSLPPVRTAIYKRSIPKNNAKAHSTSKKVGTKNKLRRPSI
jgi:hypothetical protein